MKGMRAGAKRLAVAVTLIVATTAPLAAVDGVIEINQARALAGGVTPGDGAGFPVFLNSNGSYRLTGNLTVPVDTDGLVVGDSVVLNQVTLDLNGFTIESASPPSAGQTPAGISGEEVVQLRVLNGLVSGFYTDIRTSSPAWVQSVRVAYAAFRGIDVGDDSTVVDASVDNNDFTLAAGGGGIFVGARAIVRGCKVGNNYRSGIHTDVFALVTGNHVADTFFSGTGILVSDGSTVSGNVVSSNGIGVEASSGVTLLDNTVRSNSSYGFHFTGTSNGYARNVLTFNTVDVSGTASELGTNFCGTDTVCP